MLPLVLPIPLSTEITIQALMNEASSYLNAGRYQLSYELYIEALLSAVNEFKQVEFDDKCNIGTDLSSVFVLADTCLQNARNISSQCAILNQVKPLSPPPIPPKPSRLSVLKIPPPLPNRPSERTIEMTKNISETKNAKRPNVHNQPTYTYSDEENYTDDEYDDEEYDDEDDEEGRANQNVLEKSIIGKNSSPALKVTTNRPLLARRSSTSNISNSAPSSPIAIVPSPLNAVKSFLSLPGHSDNGLRRGLAFIDSCYGSESNERFLLANGIIDPQILVSAQTNNSDSLSANHTGPSYLPMIPQAPLVTVYQSIRKKLEEKPNDKAQLQSTLNQVRNLHMSATTVPTILQFHPVLIAYQLTLIDSTIFRNISADAILLHSPKTPQPSIVASTDFFNYLTRLIEHAILLQQDASGRAQHINHWIKVAGKCHELKNYQTLKAVISALGTPPIQRLKRSWQFIPKKSMNLLEELSDLMSEASNYGKYRDRLGITFQQDEVKHRQETRQKTAIRKNSFSEPTVPFLGIFIHDMTYLVAAQSKKKKTMVHNSDWKIHKDQQEINDLQQDVRVSELLKLFKNLQRSPPYSPNLSANCVKDLKNRKRKLPQALARTAAMKITSANNDDGELGYEMQQCLVTQYLLTRSWVSEKTVDELSLVREPTKASRSYSLTDSLAAPLQQTSIPPPPPPTSSVSLTTSTQALRSSSGSLTSGSTSSDNSRPLSLEDEGQQEDLDKKSSSFWLFGRKSVDQVPYATLHRSPRHFSFEELNGKKPSLSDCRMQREGSQNSLTIFRKDFWKNTQQKQTDLQKKGPSSSTATDYRQVTNKNLKHVLGSPHPLDQSPSSELPDFQWEYSCN